MLGDDTSSAPNMNPHLRDLSLRTENCTSAGMQTWWDVHRLATWEPSTFGRTIHGAGALRFGCSWGVLWQWNLGDTVWHPKCCSIGMTSRCPFCKSFFSWNVPLASDVRPESGRAVEGQHLVDTSARGEIGLWIERCPGAQSKILETCFGHETFRRQIIHTAGSSDE